MQTKRIACFGRHDGVLGDFDYDSMAMVKTLLCEEGMELVELTEKDSHEHVVASREVDAFVFSGSIGSRDHQILRYLIGQNQDPSAEKRRRIAVVLGVASPREIFFHGHWVQELRKYPFTLATYIPLLAVRFVCE